MAIAVALACLVLAAAMVALDRRAHHRAVEDTRARVLAERARLEAALAQCAAEDAAEVEREHRFAAFLACERERVHARRAN